MEIFSVITENGFNFVSWLGSGVALYSDAALYQHDSGRLMAIRWHPHQELTAESLLTHPASVMEMTGGANSAYLLTSEMSRFEEAVKWIAEGKMCVHFPK